MLYSSTSRTFATRIEFQSGLLPIRLAPSSWSSTPAVPSFYADSSIGCLNLEVANSEDIDLAARTPYSVMANGL